jgi:hypothetical protein
MTDNLESIAAQVIEVTENIKRQYVAPAVIRLDETSIQGGSSANVAESSNGGAFTNAS